MEASTKLDGDNGIMCDGQNADFGTVRAKRLESGTAKVGTFSHNQQWQLVGQVTPDRPIACVQLAGFLMTGYCWLLSIRGQFVPAGSVYQFPMHLVSPDDNRIIGATGLELHDETREGYESDYCPVPFVPTDRISIVIPQKRRKRRQ